MGTHSLAEDLVVGLAAFLAAGGGREEPGKAAPAATLADQLLASGLKMFPQVGVATLGGPDFTLLSGGCFFTVSNFFCCCKKLLLWPEFLLAPNYLHRVIR